jgi:hypothetical protein
MKIKYTLTVLAGLVFCLFACKKDSKVNSSITGKWVLVRDSTYEGVGVSNRLVIYAGQPDDYFDFRTDGKVYTKEGAVLDTLNYSIKSSSQITIDAFGLNANGVPAVSIMTVTAHNATIAAPRFITPGGEFGRQILLKR